ncbi:MAG: delta-60 repeat domain-containing protein [Candidatus Nanopelagicales bacterium]|nr:delta-60 repeat domain-containing protein [Candidatus Nanopelagicales bacterium]MDZ4248777.1 delta-60 repeat domain-containing protein [Candidatus Nanopelagicales bacterium]
MSSKCAVDARRSVWVTLAGAAATGLILASIGGAQAADPGQFDRSFNATLASKGGLGGPQPVGYAVQVQSNRKIVVAGSFTEAGGKGANNLARFKASGAPDKAFNKRIRRNGGLDYYVSSVAVQRDGKIVAAGDFTHAGGMKVNRIARFKASGAPDKAFNKRIRRNGGLNASAMSVVVQTDGKIVVTGGFTKACGKMASGLARFKAGGAPDKAFNKHIRRNGGTDVGANSVAVQRDGKIVVGGDFGRAGGRRVNSLARFKAGGAPDKAFNKHIRHNGGVLDEVDAVATGSDGKVVVTGWFTKAGGKAVNGIVRFGPHGAPDKAFNKHIRRNGGLESDVFVADVRSVAIQRTGKIVVAGYFTTAGGIAANGIARFGPHGAGDKSFNMNIRDNGGITGDGSEGDSVGGYSLAVQRSGKIVVVGMFSTAGGRSAPNLSRLFGG